MNRSQFIEALGATVVPKSSGTQYTMPEMHRADVEQRVGQPRISMGPNGFVMQFQLDDGGAVILAPVATDNLISHAVVFVFSN